MIDVAENKVAVVRRLVAGKSKFRVATVERAEFVTGLAAGVGNVGYLRLPTLVFEVASIAFPFTTAVFLMRWISALKVAGAINVVRGKIENAAAITAEIVALGAFVTGDICKAGVTRAAIIFEIRVLG